MGRMEGRAKHIQEEPGFPAGAWDPGAPQPQVIINADDWGRDAFTTNSALECKLHGSISSVSAMVFMEDSERAAQIALNNGIDAGLHFNFTTAFSAENCPSLFKEHQAKVSRFLMRSRFAPTIFHPGLAASFDLLVNAQVDEYERLYGTSPHRVDGHHHMHLCANMLLGRLLPRNTIVRRNFRFSANQKGPFNRAYRRWQDWLLARHHPTTDLFFALPPFDPERLRMIFDLAKRHKVEIETHPANPDEYEFLISGELFRYTGAVAVARGYLLGTSGETALDTKPPDQDPGARGEHVASIDRAAGAAPDNVPHICVCICTYKRADRLRALLSDLTKQHTAGLFTYSAVIADNDPARSAEATVTELRTTLTMPVKYCSEPRRGIALARNKVVANAEGDYLALIDDDEFPTPRWLLNLFNTCNQFKVDGVLGPVKRHFEETPPEWFRRSRLYDRRVNPTGMRVHWHEARTGNALLRRELFAGDSLPFRPQFRAGEDQDFFRRKLEEGRSFIWSADAAVFEVIPPARWRRKYIVRKALLHGVNGAQQPNCGAISILKSVIAVPTYTVCLPFTLLAGQEYFMELVEKLCNHAGKLMYLMKINPIREEYVSD